MQAGVVANPDGQQSPSPATSPEKNDHWATSCGSGGPTLDSWKRHPQSLTRTARGPKGIRGAIGERHRACLLIMGQLAE